MKRFTKLDSMGKALADSAKDWAGVRENTHANGDPRKKPVIWDKNHLPDQRAAAQDARLAAHKVCGKKAAAPALIDLFELAPRNDTERAEFDKYFPNCPRSWFRAKEAYAPNPDCRWGVAFGLGGSSGLDDGYGSFVRAVRSSQ